MREGTDGRTERGFFPFGTLREREEGSEERREGGREGRREKGREG